MAIVRCENGHYYDSEKFSRCPHCGIFAGKKDDMKTVALGRGSGSTKKGAGDGHKTMPFGNLFRKPAADHTANHTVDHTIAMGQDTSRPDDELKTIGIWSDARGNDFVTGWIVCVKGPERGRDYRLFHGMNHVGRSADMDVCIMDDTAISRENHCTITYEPRSNRFFLTPMNGNTVRQNGEMLDKPKELKTGDIIGIGMSEFEFIAFCRGERKWESGSDTSLPE